MEYSTASIKVQEHLDAFFEAQKDERFIYHNKAHTTSVVANAIEIATYYKLNEEELFIVTTAAWFHDIGYFLDPTKHELAGATAAAEYLASIHVPAAIIDAVKGCIMATKMPQSPVGLLQEIVCDADLFHLGTIEFSERNKLMRKECEAVHCCIFAKGNWRENTIQLMECHHYHTAYCKDLLQATKQQNLANLKAKAITKALGKELKNIAEEGQQQSENFNNKGLKEEKLGRGRGVETMFRVTSNNHQRLSDMADNKAHIMITTTSIIISVLLTVLLRKLEEYPHLTIPAIMLLVICVVTMVFSILATRPTIPSGVFTEKDLHDKNVNLLFFGNFYNMTLKDYTAGMQKLMDNKEFLYGSLTRDIYSQGVVLGRKYKLLRLAYNVFMFGIVASVLAFVVAALIFGK